MAMKWKALAVLAVTVPATAYVVSETVVDEPPSATRSAVVLDRSRAPSDDAVERRRTANQAVGSTRPSTREDSCGDRDRGDQDDRGDRADEDDRGRADEVLVVRPCPTEVGDDDRDDRAGDLDDREDEDDGADDTDDSDDDEDEDEDD